MPATLPQPAANPSPTRTDLSVTGMTCQNCARHVGEALQTVPGVGSATVSLQDQRASVRWLPQAAPDHSALIESLRDAGYTGQLIEPSQQKSEHECHSSAWESTLWLALAATAYLMLGEWGLGLQRQGWFRWSAFAVATLVQVFAGSHFYQGAWNQLKLGRSNMDTLVALGSSTAYLYSVFLLFSGSSAHLYFMEAASIISLITLGHWIEGRVSLNASKSLEKLLHLAPRIARRLTGDREEDVPVSRLKESDRVVVRPGDQVPTDGVIQEGSSSFDESMLTGESMPVDKDPADPVYAGTLNLSARVVLTVTAVGESTALASIIAAVERAQNSRAAIQRLGDRVSSVFVPIVVMVALAAGLFWAFAPTAAGQVYSYLAQFLWHSHLPQGRWAPAFMIPAAVLIVACPCAMGLATPAAIMAASNAASRRGILIRDGVALEKAGAVTAVLLDKTGTLTIGTPKVAATFVMPQVTISGVDPISIASALARLSNHPLSKAIAALNANQGSVLLTDSTEERGAGVKAFALLEDGKKQTLRLGSLRWLRDSGVIVGEDHPFIREWTAKAASLVGVAAENRLLGLFAISDSLKPGASEVIRQLHSHGLNVYLVTGDHKGTAQAIAAQSGISPENTFAEVRPEEKAAVVKRLQAQGQRVAFVGDGINDAPALEQADLGIAVSRASDVAREAADIILLNSEITAIPHALGLAKSTLRVIKQNLFWAFFYNALGIPLAALGFMSPILCAAAMGLSDVVVIGNALRLLRR